MWAIVFSRLGLEWACCQQRRQRIIVWKVQTSPTSNLAQESTSPQLNSGQDAGFFTTVSSNGTQNPINWAVGRPVDTSPANVTLYAFDPLAAAQTKKPARWLLSAVAGTWPNPMSNANIVPVVANGHAYVASYKQLSIFGFASTTVAVQSAQTTQQVSSQPAQQALLPLPSNGHEIFGTIPDHKRCNVNGRNPHGAFSSRRCDGGHASVSKRRFVDRRSRTPSRNLRYVEGIPSYSDNARKRLIRIMAAGSLNFWTGQRSCSRSRLL